MKVKRIDATGRFPAIDDEGNHYLIFEFVYILWLRTESDPEGEEMGDRRYMLADRTSVRRISETEFVLIESGRKLYLTGH